MMFKKTEGGRMEINPEILITEVATKVHTERMKLPVQDRPEDTKEAIIQALGEHGISSLDAEYFLPKVRSLMADLYFENPENYSLEKKPDLDLGLDDRRVPPQHKKSQSGISLSEKDTGKAGRERLTYGEMSTESGLKGEDIAHVDELSQDAEI